MSNALNSVRINGLRGYALLVMGFYALTRGIAYLPAFGPLTARGAEFPQGLSILSNLFPIEVWAGIWIVVGIQAFIRAFSYSDSVAWGFLVGMMVIWGLGYGAGWVTSLAEGDANREWLSAISYLGPAVAISILTARTAGK